MKFELVIFDWDGTLANSMDRIVDSMRGAGDEIGMPAVPDSRIQNIIGLGLPEALKAVWNDITEDQMDKMRESYARRFVSGSNVEMALFDGAQQLIEQLKMSDVKVAVATGKSRKGLDRILNDLGLTNHFHTTRCADETASKPEPLMLAEILAELGVDASSALMVGDTTYDLDMANAIRMPSVAMSHGAHDENLLQSRNPRAILHSISELKDWLYEITD